LLKQEQITSLVSDEGRLRLLWQVCQIPDYRKLMIDEHAWLLGEIFVELSKTGVLSDEYLRKKILRLREHSGDIDAIMGRIASVRTWAYVSQHQSWVKNGDWQAQTRQIDDALSDDLHRALVERFVSKTKRRRERTLAPKKGDRSLSSQLSGLRAKLEGAPPDSEVSFSERLLSAEQAQFQLNETGTLEFDGLVVGTLARGRKIGEPRLSFAELTQEGPSGSQGRIEEHLRQVLRQKLDAFFDPLRVLEEGDDSEEAAALRGISYQLVQGLGAVRTSTLRDLVRALSSKGRAAFFKKDIVLGRRFVYSRPSLQMEAQVLRRALFGAFIGKSVPLGSVEMGLHRLSHEKEKSRLSSSDLELLGYELWGQRALRIDLVESLLLAAQGKTQKQRQRLVMDTLGVDEEEARRIGRQLGAGGSPRRRRKRRKASA
jgi:ATP-dependent RNA helicase SUPV3L1/SUV3